MAVSLYNGKNHSIADICRTLNVSRATLYRHLRTLNVSFRHIRNERSYHIACLGHQHRNEPGASQ